MDATTTPDHTTATAHATATPKTRTTAEDLSALTLSVFAGTGGFTTLLYFVDPLATWAQAPMPAIAAGAAAVALVCAVCWAIARRSPAQLLGLAGVALGFSIPLADGIHDHFDDVHPKAGSPAAYAALRNDLPPPARARGCREATPQGTQQAVLRCGKDGITATFYSFLTRQDANEYYRQLSRGARRRSTYALTRNGRALGRYSAHGDGRRMSVYWTNRLKFTVAVVQDVPQVSPLRVIGDWLVDDD